MADPASSIPIPTPRPDTPDDSFGHKEWSGTLPANAVFPLKAVPPYTWRSRPRYFGAPRGARKHAACDLWGAFLEEVFAIADGEMLYLPQNFYNSTWEVAIYHPGIGVARYGEIARDDQLSLLSKDQHDRISALTAPLRGKKPATTAPVKAGDLIGVMGKFAPPLQNTPSMLHFELYEKYTGHEQTDLQLYANLSRKPFQRRADVMNAAVLMDQLSQHLPGAK